MSQEMGTSGASYPLSDDDRVIAERARRFVDDELIPQPASEYFVGGSPDRIRDRSVEAPQ